MKLKLLAKPLLLVAAGCSTSIERHEEAPEVQTLEEEVDYTSAEPPALDEQAATMERESGYD